MKAPTMKAPVRWIFCCAYICVLNSTGLGQAGYGTPSGAASGTLSYNTQIRAGQTNNPNEKFFHARSLVGQQIKDAKGQILGSVYDIAFNPQSGDTFITIGVGAGRYALVPWQALVLTSGAGGQDELTLNTSLRDLQAGPTITSSDWEKLNNPDFTQSLYSRFNLLPPIAVGGTAAGDLGGRSIGGSTGTMTETNKATSARP